MTIQNALETTIDILVDEFKRNPFAFFTEADAVARFHQLLDRDPVIGQQVQTADGYRTSLIHREYPTFFRFADKNPTARLDPPAHRGHYDTVILSPEFATAHPAATVTNRDIKAKWNRSIIPFQAVVEFKLDNLGWSKGRAAGVAAELGKLHLSAPEASLRYLVVLMRYSAPNLRRWNKYWPTVQQTAMEKSEIGSIFAVHWLTHGGGTDVYRFGQWVAGQ